MKKLIIENQVTEVLSICALDTLYVRIITCDYHIAYKTASGHIAKLVSYMNRQGKWEVGFKYINSNDIGHIDRLYFVGYNHKDSVEKAINNCESDILLFSTTVEFIEWFNRNNKN